MVYVTCRKEVYAIAARSYTKMIIKLLLFNDVSYKELQPCCKVKEMLHVNGRSRNLFVWEQLLREQLLREQRVL